MRNSKSLKSLLATLPLLAAFTFLTLTDFYGQITYSENFDSGFPAGWTKVNMANPMWTNNSGSTLSGSTGPSGAYGGSGNYMYYETSGGSTGSIDRLISISYDLTTSNAPASIEFYYHMFGATMGTLQLDVSTDGGANWVNLFSISGQQQTAETDSWTQAVVSLDSYVGNNLLFRFNGIRGTSFTSDMAIDNMIITASTCTNPSATYSVVDDCGNGQFNIDVNVSGLGDASGVDITDGVTTFQTNVGTGTYTVGPFTAGDSKVIQVNGSPFGGCDVTSSSLSEACECLTAPTATVNAVNLDCGVPDYDIEVTVTNYGSGTSSDIYIDNVLQQTSASLSTLYIFSGYAPGSHSVEIRAVGGSFVSCTQEYTVNETCNGSETCGSAPDITNDCASGDLTSAVADGGALIENYLACGNGNTIALCAANAGFTGSSYTRTDHADIWYKVYPNGANEFTVTISNLTGGQIMVLPYLTNGTCPSTVGDNATMESHIGNAGTSLTSGSCPYFTSDGSLTFSGTDLTTASVVYLRVMPYANNGSGATNCETLTYPTFDICTSVPAANDIDDDAIEIDGTSSSGDLCAANVEVESTETGDVCSESADNNDLWYKISAGAGEPNAHGKITVTFTNATDAVVITEYWGAFTNTYQECVTLTSTGAGSSVSYTFADEIPAGSSNYYRVRPVSGNGVCSFTIDGERVATNDNCDYFTNALPGYDLDNGSFAMDFNYASASGKAGVSGKDLWYAVDHNANQSITISTTAQTPDWDGTAAIYLYEYPSFLSLDCDNLVEYCSQTGLDDFDLESGVTFNLGTGDYLLRIVETAVDPGGDQIDVTISGTTSVASILSNSSCANALDISSGSQTGNFSQAQLACPSAAITCGATTYNSLPSDAYYGAALWYKFTMPGTACSGAAPTVSTEIRSIEVSVSSLSTSSGAGTKNAYVELYSDCNTILECGQSINNSSNVTFENLTPGDTYYLRFINNTLTSTSTSDFTVEVIIPGDPAPCNDFTSDAYPLPVLTDLEVATLPIYSADGATTSEFTDDVWFEFTAPTANGDSYPTATADLSFVTVYAENISGDVFQVEVWDTISGNDGATDEITTLDPQDRTLSGIGDYTFFQLGHLVPGQRYWLQVKFSSPAKSGLIEKAGSNEQFKLAVLNPGEDNTSLCTTGSTTKPVSITGCEGDCQAIYKFEVDVTGDYQIEATGDGVDVVINVYQSDTEDGGEQAEGYPYDYDHPCQIDRNDWNSISPTKMVSTTSIPSNEHGCPIGNTGERNVYNFVRSTTTNRIYYFIEVIDQSAAGSKHGCGGPELCELQVYAVGSSTTLYTGDCKSYNVALPVELVSMNAYNANDDNVVIWSTGSEINNSHFDVEHSLDGFHYEVLGKVNGQGNSTTLTNYEFVHPNVQSGKHYYRLMQVDFDGNRTYTEVVTTTKVQNEVISVYPNPTNGTFFVNLKDNVRGNLLVKNALGQIVFQLEITTDVELITLDQMPSGTYFICLESEMSVQTKRLVVK